jgi:hypothetical protein|tara:strand:+ start:710 stop:1162 length:453 start_codon:yes stop_codon:yes gene_type:complete
MIYELIAATFLGMAIWLPIYKYYISRIVGDHVVARVENKEIDLNYLLDNGGVFDELANRVVTLFKQHMLAEMGQLSNQSKGVEGLPELGLSPDIGVGIEAATQLLNMVGMKKPPAMITMKVAQALGQLVQNHATAPDTGDEVGRFYPDRP